MQDHLFARAAANRRQAADLLAGLSPEQWQTPTLCAGWTVRVLAGHLLMPLEVNVRRVALRLVRERGSFDRVTDSFSRALAERPTDQIVATLGTKADAQVAPAGVGPLGPLTDSCIHLLDMARPLHLDVSPPLDDWPWVLDFLVSARARAGFVPRGRLKGLRWQASDQDWKHGQGSLVVGPSAALALAMTGRPAALPELTGPGVETLRRRLALRD